MLDFRFIKEVIEKDGDVTLKRLFHASSYNGGILLRTTTLMRFKSGGFKSVAVTITNLPMAEIYEIEKGKLDIRMVTFNLHQIGMDIGFDLKPEEQRGPDIMTSECKE